MSRNQLDPIFLISCLKGLREGIPIEWRTFKQSRQSHEQGQTKSQRETNPDWHVVIQNLDSWKTSSVLKGCKHKVATSPPNLCLGWDEFVKTHVVTFLGAFAQRCPLYRYINCWRHEVLKATRDAPQWFPRSGEVHVAAQNPRNKAWRQFLQVRSLGQRCG